MSDLEGFGGGEAGEGIDPQALERFRERMRKNAAAIAAIQKSEQKQKKTEDKLAKILAQFIKNATKSDLVRLLARCLAENIPATLILHIVLLGNEDLQKEAGVEIKLLANKAAEATDEKAITPFSFADKTLPLKLKIEIDTWIAHIMEAASATPHKILKSACFVTEKEKDIPKKPLVKLFTFVLEEFLHREEQELDYDALDEFAAFVLKGVMKKLRSDLDSRKEVVHNTTSPVDKG